MHAFKLKAGAEELVALVDVKRAMLGWAFGNSKGSCDLTETSAGFKALSGLVAATLGGAKPGRLGGREARTARARR